MTLKNALSIAALTLLAASGCNEPPLLEVYDLPEELPEIDVSYIPFEWFDTGHEYHMPLLAMELAAKGVPSAFVEVQDCAGDFKLEAPNGDRWGYHMAVAIKNGGAVRVVDPVLSSELLSLDDFQSTFHDSNTRLILGSGEDPTDACEDQVISEVPARVEDMQKFDFANVLIYCSYLRNFYRHIGGDYDAREEMLLSRVRALSLKMDELGLLEVDSPEAEEFALLKKQPYCPPAIGER
jgi:hypothetical protein